MREGLGSRELAERDLYAMVRDGRLPSVMRHISYSNGEEKCIPLGTKYWRRTRLFATSNTDRSNEYVRLNNRDGNLSIGYGVVFVRTAALDRFYPPTTPSSVTALPAFPVRDTRGAKEKFDWEAVLVAGVDIMARDRCTELAKFIAAVYAHFGQTWKQGGPSPTQMNTHLAPLFRVMTAVLGI